jgi:hypothetical protein
MTDQVDQRMERQLEALKEWHKAIEERPRPSGATPPEMLADQWEVLECHSVDVAANKSFILRGRTYDDRPPLAQLFDYVEAGFYPPPELLIAAFNAWVVYRERAGDLELEEAMLGRRVPRGGNYAARAMAKRKELGKSIALGQLMDEGMTKDAAAQHLACKYSISAEVLKRFVIPIRKSDCGQE